MNVKIEKSWQRLIFLTDTIYGEIFTFKICLGSIFKLSSVCYLDDPDQTTFLLRQVKALVQTGLICLNTPSTLSSTCYTSFIKISQRTSDW